MKEKFNVELGSILKSIREAKNITQSEVAAKLGVTKMTISHYESGERSLSTKNLKKYCEALDVSIGSVFDRM